MKLIRPPLTLDQERVRASWKYKCVLETRGHQTKLGCIVLAIIGKTPRSPPRLSPKQGCIITEGGMVLADMQLSPGKPYLATALGNVTEVVEAMRRMCDKLKLDDADREALFAEFRKWVFKDYRAVSDMNLYDPKKLRH